MSKLPCLILLSFLIPFSALASDPVVEWVQEATRSRKQAKVSAWNPGLLPFDETELRLQSDRDDVYDEQKLRISFKPLGGMANEFRLRNQRKQILDLAFREIEEGHRLQAYIDVLYFWKTLESKEVIKASEPIFSKASQNLDAIRRAPGIDFDTAGFISDLALFASLKGELASQYQQTLIRIEKASGNSKGLHSAILALNFIDLAKIQAFVAELEKEQLPLQLEEETKQLKFFEFEKKKRESYQLLKFVDVGRENRYPDVEDFTFQIGIRIPFLSDSAELEDAKVDYILEKNKLEQTKIDKQRELAQLKSEFQGLVEQAKILQLLPEKSNNRKKLAGSLTTIDATVKSEADFLKAKLQFINAKYEIFDRYLLMLFMLGKLDEENTNYLVSLPKS